LPIIRREQAQRKGSASKVVAGPICGWFPDLEVAKFYISSCSMKNRAPPRVASKNSIGYGAARKVILFLKKQPLANRTAHATFILIKVIL